MVKPLYNDSVAVKSPHRVCSDSKTLTQVMLTPAGKNQHDARERNVKTHILRSSSVQTCCNCEHIYGVHSRFF